MNEKSRHADRLLRRETLRVGNSDGCDNSLFERRVLF